MSGTGQASSPEDSPPPFPLVCLHKMKDERLYLEIRKPNGEKHELQLSMTQGVVLLETIADVLEAKVEANVASGGVFLLPNGAGLPMKGRDTPVCKDPKCPHYKH